MHKAEQLTSVKRELLDISMSLGVVEHEERKRTAAMRYLRARRGIELHQEIKRLERDISDLTDDDTLQ